VTFLTALGAGAGQPKGPVVTVTSAAALAGALRTAAPGTRILLKPGDYRGEWVVDRPVEIAGEGRRARIVLESVKGTCLTLRDSGAAIRGVTIRERAGGRPPRGFAVEIPDGAPLLEDCDITSNSLACVAVHGAHSSPTLRRCSIHDGKQSGVFFYDGAGGTLENCDLTRIGLSGIEIRDRANPALRNCTIHGRNQRGVFVWGGGRATIEACDFSGSALGVVAIRDASATITHSKIRNGHASGAYFENGSGRLEDCDVTNNRFAGVEVTDTQGEGPMIERCRLRGNPRAAVWAHDRGKATVRDCEGEGLLRADAGSRITEAGNRLSTPGRRR